MWRSRGKSGGDFLRVVFEAVEVNAGREHRQDSEAVGESFWDGQAVEIEAKPFLRLRRGTTYRHVMTR